MEEYNKVEQTSEPQDEEVQEPVQEAADDEIIEPEPIVKKAWETCWS